MGRGGGVKCIKCPLLSFMDGLKDLQSTVMMPSITAAALLIFMALATAEASGAVVTMSSASFVKSFTSASTPELSRGDEGRTRRPFPRRTRTPSFSKKEFVMIGAELSPLREAMFSVIHRGDTVSARRQDHKRSGPVCMWMKQFVSLRSNQTPSFSTNPAPSEVRPRFSTNILFSSFLISSGKTKTLQRRHPEN